MVKTRAGAALLLVCTAIAACGSSDDEACAKAQAQFSLCGIGGLEQGCSDYSRCQLDCFNIAGCAELKEVFFGPMTELSAPLLKCMSECQ